MAKESLIKKFANKYFTKTEANQLRAVKFGEFLYQYFLPNEEITKDPAKLLVSTRQVMLANERHISAQEFVRMMLVYFSQKPELVSYDMVADLLESDEYKKFGAKNADDNLLKKSFEDWVINDSTLGLLYADRITPANSNVVLNKDGMQRVLTALENSGYNQNGVKPDFNGYKDKIDAQVNDFNTVYVNNMGADGFDKLLANNQNKNQKYADKLKNAYGILGGQQYGEALGKLVDASTAGQDSKTRNAFFEGHTLDLNLTLLAVAQQKGWTNDQIENILVKTPAEINRDKFLPKEQQGFHPVLDVVKTFGMTLGGATAITALSSVPVVGRLVGPLVGLSMIVGAGKGTYIKNYNAAEAKAKAEGRKLSSSEKLKISLKAGIAMVGKATPYVVSAVAGPLVYRGIGAGIVFAQTMINDLNRRADERMADVERYEVQHGKPKNIFEAIKNVVKASNIYKLGTHMKEGRLKASDFVKAGTYGVAKGGAAFLGGAIGREFGTAVSHSIDYDQIKADLAETKVGKLVGSFNGLHHGTDVSDDFVETKETAANDKLSKVNVAGLDHDSGLHANQLSDDNLDRLSKIGRVELTEHARMTADVNAHPGRQYVGGVRENWYNFEQQQNAIHTLQDAGVEDAEGVLRKMGSLARFESAGEIEKGGYQDTLNHLKAGSINNRDVDNLFQALARINEEGGLGRGHTVPTPTPTPAPAPAPTPVAIPTFESAPSDPMPELVTEPIPEPTPAPEPIKIPTFDSTPNESIPELVTEPESTPNPAPEPYAIPAFVTSENATDEISLDAPVETISNDIVEAENVAPVVIPGFAYENNAAAESVTDSSAEIPNAVVSNGVATNPTATAIPAFANSNGGTNANTSAPETVDSMRSKFYNAYNVDIELLKQLNEASAARSDDNLTNRIFGYSDLNK